MTMVVSHVAQSSPNAIVNWQSFSIGAGNTVHVSNGSGDTLSGALATAAVASSPAGSYAIGQGTLAASLNYSLVFNPGTLSVTARPKTLYRGTNLASGSAGVFDLTAGWAAASQRAGGDTAELLAELLADLS